MSTQQLKTLFEASPCIYRGQYPIPLFFRRGLAHTYITSTCFILIIVISIIPGGLLCCLSTLPHLSEGLSSDSKFNLALVGQALTGRVSVQGVKSLGGHFACVCRGFDFYEVEKKVD